MTTKLNCGCQNLTIQHDLVGDSLVVRCDQGRETKVNVGYTTLMLVDNEEAIDHIARLVAHDHGLDIEDLSAKLRETITARDSTGRIKVR